MFYYFILQYLFFSFKPDIATAEHHVFSVPINFYSDSSPYQKDVTRIIFTIRLLAISKNKIIKYKMKKCKKVIKIKFSASKKLKFVSNLHVFNTFNFYKYLEIYYLAKPLYFSIATITPCSFRLESRMKT